MSDFAIELDGISKYYKLYDDPRDRLKEALHPFGKKYHKEFYALKNLNLKIKKGEILGIVGKNGSGKSTLLKIIGGVLKPSSGAVKTEGKISALLELGAGFNPEFTGLQNIFFYGTILGMPRKMIEEKLDVIVSFADIGEFITQPLKTYSSGMKSRLAFSSAVHIEPDILIIDEVLSVGDAAFQKKSLRKMESLVNSGATVIFVSHSESLITRFCERAIYLRRGEMVVEGSATNVVRLYMKDSESKKQLTAKALQDEYKAIENGEARNYIPPAEKLLVDKSMFSPGIAKKSSPVITQNFPVNIDSVQILNTFGKKVNLLESGKKYTLECAYKFSQPISSVVFPVSFYNSKNFELFGIRHPYDGSSIDILDLTRDVIFKCEFVASFLPGSYYFSVGVTQLSEESKLILLRCEDAISFDVIQESDDVQWGQVIIETNIMHECLNEPNL